LPLLRHGGLPYNLVGPTALEALGLKAMLAIQQADVIIQRQPHMWGQWHKAAEIFWL